MTEPVSFLVGDTREFAIEFAILLTDIESGHVQGHIQFHAQDMTIGDWSDQVLLSDCMHGIAGLAEASGTRWSNRFEGMAVGDIGLLLFESAYGVRSRSDARPEGFSIRARSDELPNAYGYSISYVGMSSFDNTALFYAMPPCGFDLLMWTTFDIPATFRYALLRKGEISRIARETYAIYRGLMDSSQRNRKTL